MLKTHVDVSVNNSMRKATNESNHRTPDAITFSKADEFKLHLAELSSSNVPGPASFDSAESIDVVMQSVVKRASPPIESKR